MLDAAAADRPATRPAAVEWAVRPGLVGYPAAIAAMDRRVGAIAARVEPECALLLAHPPLITAGTSARKDDLLDSNALPVFRSGRGGQYTYHGPGQRIVYVMLDLGRRGLDVRRYVAELESWLIRTLTAFGVSGERRSDRVGVWVPGLGGGEAKIAAIGIRVRRRVSFHGVALNVDPDLSHYAGIVPCGARGFGVTSLRALGVGATMAEVDAVLRREFEAGFGP